SIVDGQVDRAQSRGAAEVLGGTTQLDGRDHAMPSMSGALAKVMGRVGRPVTGPLLGQTASMARPCKQVSRFRLQARVFAFLVDAGVLDRSLRKLRQACVFSFLEDAGVLDRSLRKLRSRPSSRWANSLARHSASFMPPAPPRSVPRRARGRTPRPACRR